MNDNDVPVSRRYRSAIQQTPRTLSSSKPHLDVANRFKHPENKYGGADEENLQEFISQYFLISDDCGLSQAQRLQYIHNIFKGEALRFYNSEVKGIETTLGGAIAKIRDHFNGADKQQRIKAELSSLTLEYFIRRNNGSIRDGLGALATYITNRVPQCPPSFRSEQNKVDFLRQSVIGHDWARNVLCRINSDIKFQQLYLELATALQVHEESNLKQSNIHHEIRDSSNSKKPFILFTQPKYARKLTKKLFSGSEMDQKCWNCGLTGHRFSKCRKPLNLKSVAARKAEFMEKKYGKNGSKRTLFELAQGMSELLELDEEVNDDLASTYFEEIKSDNSFTESDSQEENDLEEKAITFSTKPEAFYSNVQNNRNKNSDF